MTKRNNIFAAIERIISGDTKDIGLEYTDLLRMSTYWIDDKYNLCQKSYTVESIVIESKDSAIVTYRQFGSLDGAGTFKVKLDIFTGHYGNHLYAIIENAGYNDVRRYIHYFIAGEYRTERFFVSDLRYSLRNYNKSISHICKEFLKSPYSTFRNYNADDHWVENIGSGVGIYRISVNGVKAVLEKGYYTKIKPSRFGNPECSKEYVDVAGVINGVEFEQQMRIIYNGLYYENDDLTLCYTSNIQEAIGIKRNLNAVLSGHFEFTTTKI